MSELCALAGVSRSGYYQWLHTEDKRDQRERRDREDFLLILEAYHYRGYKKGFRSIKERLRRNGIIMNHKKILRLMHKYGLKCPIRKHNPYREMMRNLRTSVVAPNHVDRQFKAYGPRKILLTDITYIKVKDIFCYLSVIIDAFTMQVLSYQLSDSLEVSFVLRTVNDLIEKHGDTLKDSVYLHSDQGAHYTSISYRELITGASIIQSMSRKGNCWDNAPQESFFGHMKDEIMPYQDEWYTIEDLQLRIDDWIDYYNTDRFQAGLGMLTPDEFYIAWKQTR